MCVSVYMIVLYSFTPLQKWLAITIYPILNLKDQKHMFPHVYSEFAVFLFLVDGETVVWAIASATVDGAAPIPRARQV